MEMQTAERLANLTANNYSEINIKIKTVKDHYHLRTEFIAFRGIPWGSMEFITGGVKLIIAPRILL